MSSYPVTTTHTTPRPRPLWSLEQAAEYLGCHPMTVRRAVASGQIPAVRFGRQIRVYVDDVQALLTPVPTAGRVDA